MYLVFCAAKNHKMLWFLALICYSRVKKVKKMKCAYCNHDDTKVLDSRETPDLASIRRRRECTNCEKRFTTYERVEMIDISVVKKDGRREPFDRDKLLRGVLQACSKRPIKREKIDAAVAAIESQVKQMDKTEIKARAIGDLVMQQLKELDDIAYVRFASVYKKFRDANQFVAVIQSLNEAEIKEGRT